jgi:hypothetical protein
MRNHLFLGLVLVFLLAEPGAMTRAEPGTTVDGASYPTLQAAIDANPGRIIQVPVGDYVISSALLINRDNTELHGPARIVQTNAAEPILRIEQATGVRVHNLAFTRSEGRQDTNQPGLIARQCADLEFSGLRVSENHSNSSIVAVSSRDVVVQDCVVTNYKGFVIDDRTKGDRFGYAFKAVDGTGIQLREVDGAFIRNNRISEYRLLPTKQMRDRHDLGTLTVVVMRGRNTSQEMLDARYTNNWHQGSGIHLASPTVTRRAIVTGNVIEHCNQGIDIHADNVIASRNMISHCLIGLKAVHGAKNVLMTDNQVIYVDLWGILLRPGAVSHNSANAAGDKPAMEENNDGGSIIANNIISHIGFGRQAWNWPERENSHGMHLGDGPLPENPPLRDLLVVGNVVCDSGRDSVLLDGQWGKAPPRYGYAAFTDQASPNKALGLEFHDNLFESGLKGVNDCEIP